MILKRISAAIRARDWAAFAIEFSIVVLGIFVAIQVENWNQGHKDRELESSGRLSLIRDTHLRGAIANNLNDYKSLQPVLAQPIGDYRRILFEILPGRSFYDYRVGAGALNTSAIIASIEAFRSDLRFEAAANAEITYGSDTLLWIREFKQRTKEILSLLEAASSRGAA